MKYNYFNKYVVNVDNKMNNKKNEIVIDKYVLIERDRYGNEMKTLCVDIKDDDNIHGFVTICFDLEKNNIHELRRIAKYYELKKYHSLQKYDLIYNNIVYKKFDLTKN